MRKDLINRAIEIGHSNALECADQLGDYDNPEDAFDLENGWANERETWLPMVKYLLGA